MPVIYQGSKSVGQLFPDFQKLLDQADLFLNGSDKDVEVKKGLLDDAQSQVDAFQARITEAQSKIDELSDMVTKAEGIIEQLSSISTDIKQHLASAGIYTFSIQNESAGALAADLYNAMSGAGIPSNATVTGAVIIASDGAGLDAINKLLSL